MAPPLAGQAAQRLRYSQLSMMSFVLPFVPFVLCFLLWAAPRAAAQAALRLDVAPQFSFVAYGDTRFTDPANTDASNPVARRELVSRIAAERPGFILIGGDLVYKGDDAADWTEFDAETAGWRGAGIPVYPAIGNHEVKGNEQAGLSYYFARFPELRRSRFYSLRAGNLLLLVLDSNLDENSGPQGEWLGQELSHVPADVKFVIVVMHHPPLTSALDKNSPAHLPEIRPGEAELARRIEQAQSQSEARFIVIAGHVHNYERHARNGVVYLVSGGGGAHANPIHRNIDDPYTDTGVNYHYLLIEAQPSAIKITMHKLSLEAGQALWTAPDDVTVAAKAAAHSAGNK
ncbi:MAG: metallophosphoesterase [Acidobacteria bacterium]|nr:metallophosphoesterase [Acidobacteriota bacterium]